MASRSSPRFHRYYAEDFHAEPAWALGARGTAGIDYLLRKMGNGTDAEKLAALAALGRLGSYWEVSDYAEQLLTSKDAMLQSYAATALYKYSRSVSAVGTVSRAAIQTCIESDNITIFDTGLHMLLEVRPDGMDELLATALRRSAPHFFRFRALARLRAVTGVGKELRAGPRTMKTLRELAKLAPDPNDRKTAAEILEDLNVPQEKETGN